jgi:hypothetical protein
MLHVDLLVQEKRRVSFMYFCTHENINVFISTDRSSFPNKVCSICHILYLSTQYVSSTFEICIFRSIVCFFSFLLLLRLHILNKYFIIMYMAISSLTYILGFSVRFFSASLFRLGILWERKITSKSVDLNLFYCSYS